MILDGEEFSISEDRKQIKGKGKEYTIKDFQNEVGKKILFYEAAEDGTVYGFSNEEKLEKWLKEKNLLDGYKKHKELMKKIKRKRSPEEDEKIKQYQIKQVEKDKANFKKILDKHNLKQDQVQEMENLLKEDYDPHFKQTHRSLYLYDYRWYQGSYIILRGGNQYCGTRYARSYPDLGSFNFDNKANSLKLSCNSHAYVYAGKNYEWPYLHIIWNIGDLSNWLNSISSAVVY